MNFLSYQKLQSTRSPKSSNEPEALVTRLFRKSVTVLKVVRIFLSRFFDFIESKEPVLNARAGYRDQKIKEPMFKKVSFLMAQRPTDNRLIVEKDFVGQLIVAQFPQ